jgi:predicted metalloprotease with PDZ domain
MTRRVLLLCIPVLAGAGSLYGQNFSFTVSMQQPANHTFHVVMRCDGLAGEFQDFKMPVWMPGYYRVLDYAKNVANFRAADGAGRPLEWEKVGKNAWRVVTGGAAEATLEYDVTGTVRFAAQNYLAEDRAYIAPPGMFLHVAGKLHRPAMVSVHPAVGWKIVATGLDPVPGLENTFSAADFDVLYDAPILAGNQELLHFEVKGVPHRVAIENVPAAVDREKMIADLKRMVEAATSLVGDVPYRHYTFLMMGQGNGGIEHLNSASIAFNGASLATPDGYRRWLSYVAHEYFHNFNVKRIRPIALGPFDYDRENLTNMLWVSEGLSVYYQDLLCVRAGLVTPEQYLEKMRDMIQRFENAAGHRYQSATESSWNTWGTSGVGGDRSTSISYYDNGAMLGALLDLSIRHATGSRRSLDDVVRALYRKYYREKHRGFTDAEFRAECETAASGPLAEVFEYASTTKEMNYAKYFAWAGLEVSASAAEGKGAWLGVNVQARDAGLVVTDVAPGSPAEKAGLRAGDLVVEVDGATKATVKLLSDTLTAKKPGDHVKLKAAAKEMEAELAITPQWTYAIKPVASPTAEQGTVREGWLGK